MMKYSGLEYIFQKIVIKSVGGLYSRCDLIMMMVG